MEQQARPRVVKALQVVEALCAFFGYLGGVMFFVDPSGKSYGLDSELPSLPVKDFLLVGVWLFVVYGIGFTVAAIALRRRQPWAWLAAVGLSAVWVAWIAVETSLLGVDALILGWLVPPVLALILSFLPGVRRQLRAPPRAAPAR